MNLEKMANVRQLLSIVLFLNLATAVQAGQTLVLVHGYLSDSQVWRETGIVYTLHRAGWQDGGDLFPWGTLGRAPWNSAEQYVYAVNLPSEAPLPVQAQWLDFYLYQLQLRHPDNAFILIGHSAGGVVARLTMVMSQAPVVGLLTIASPHLGTDAAEDGLRLSNSPVSWVAPFLGLGTINRSEDLYRDLIREYPATPLFWLNRQPHPKAFYASIIRVGADKWVAPYSQDLNDVPALHGQALTLTTVGRHSLHPADGQVIVSLLEKFQKSKKL